MLILIGVATGLATTLGGLFALRFRDKLHIILGFSAGAIVGVAFFELLPESIELGRTTYSVANILTVSAVGFILYTALDRWLLVHGHTDDCEHDTQRGTFGAASLVFHSLLDGVTIGLAFHVSTVIGVSVAAAVLAHDFSDGVNTVGMVLRQGNRLQLAYRWLILDALAPLVGILLTYLMPLSQSTLALVLALFGGFFLSIGASDLIPESHHSHPKRLTTAMTVLGMALIYLVVRLAE